MSLASRRGTVGRFLLSTIVAWGIGPGCKSESPATSAVTEPGWLESCATKAECPSGFDCFCGVCAPSCAAQGDCRGLAGASCVDAPSFSTFCAATGSACVAKCVKDADCSALAGAKCDLGYCAKPASSDAGASADPARFLDVCLGPSDCASGYECYCGVCSKRCTASSDCAGLPGGAACPTQIPVTSACGKALPRGEVCAIECAADADCAALDATAICTAGWCRRPLPGGGADGAVLDCNERAVAANNRLDPVAASANRACSADADCERVTLSNVCLGDGCTGAYVSHAGATTIRAELTAIETDDCPAALRAGCVGPGLRSCPAQSPATCVGGRCQDSGGDAGAAP